MNDSDLEIICVFLDISGGNRLYYLHIKIE